MQNTTDSELEIVAPSAIGALEKASIDSQVATAHAYPRSLKKFQTSALDMATLDLDTAESCIYCRPVGKEKNDKGQWVEKYAEGASIRLAEIVAASYGNIRVAARIIEQTPRFVRCEGVAHDLESNYAGKSECIESTVTKEGVPYSERQRALIAKVCLAKAYRDAVSKVVPKALWKKVIDAAKNVIAGADKPIEERRKKVQAWVGTLKIDEKRVFAALGVNGWPEVGNEHLVTLSGLKTALADKDTTIDEAFPPETAPQTAPSIFTAGSGTPTPAATTTAATTPPESVPTDVPPPTKLEELRTLLEKNTLKEASALQHIRAQSVSYETLRTLDEVFEMAPSAIEKTVKDWKVVMPKLKALEGQKA